LVIQDEKEPAPGMQLTSPPHGLVDAPEDINWKNFEATTARRARNGTWGFYEGGSGGLSYKGASPTAAFLETRSRRSRNLRSTANRALRM